MPSKKKISDLEYNVFGHNNDNEQEGLINPKDTGCMTMLAGIIVTILVVVMLVGLAQVGRNGPSPTCAEPGCSNKLKPGGNYCWLHSGSSTGGSRGGTSSSGSSSNDGSLIGGGSSSKESSSKDAKIWSGNGSDRNKSSSEDSGSSSSSGGSSISG